MPDQAGKYARFELERRFLVTRLPDGITDHPGWRITDRYIPATHLRLRRMEPLHEADTIFKLGQKQMASPSGSVRTTITNIYLSADEYAVLTELDAHEIHKRRYSVPHSNRVISVDIFQGHLSGLIIAEVSFETDTEMVEPLELPSWVGREVSDEIRFTGGALARLTRREADELVRQLQGSDSNRP